MHQLPGGLSELFELGPAIDAPRFAVYSPTSTSRLEYACEFIFGNVLGASWRIIGKLSDVADGECLVNYSAEDIAGAFRIRPHQLLFETGVAERHPQAFFRDKQIYFFANGEKANGLHFDLFSAVFYFISRMEEWQPFTPDAHGRFDGEASLLFRSGYHLKPVVDEWICGFSRELRRQFPKVSFRKRPFRVVSTIDVDNLYAYRDKGMMRTLGGAVKDLMRLDLAGLAERTAVVCGLRNDPFDIYESVSAFCRDKNIPLFYFFLMRGGTKFDRTIDPARGVFKPVLEQVSGHYTGLHPSYDTIDNEKLLSEESDLLRVLNGKAVKYSRQHFLRFDIRKTPSALLRNGIETDFSMGFAGMAGFRAGTSFPFYYYDIAAEKKTTLLFVPFCVMDGAYSIYKKSDPRTAMAELMVLATGIKETGGYFVSVFHERTFSDRLYRGYGTLYKKLHERLKVMEQE